MKGLPGHWLAIGRVMHENWVMQQHNEAGQQALIDLAHDMANLGHQTSREFVRDVWYHVIYNGEKK